MNYWIHDPSSWDSDTIELDATDQEGAIAEVLALARGGRLTVADSGRMATEVELFQVPVVTIDLRPVIAELAERSERQRLAQVEASERAALARLRTKYGDGE